MTGNRKECFVELRRECEDKVEEKELSLRGSKIIKICVCQVLKLNAIIVHHEYIAIHKKL